MFSSKGDARHKWGRIVHLSGSSHFGGPSTLTAPFDGIVVVGYYIPSTQENGDSDPSYREITIQVGSYTLTLRGKSEFGTLTIPCKKGDRLAGERSYTVYELK